MNTTGMWRLAIAATLLLSGCTKESTGPIDGGTGGRGTIAITLSATSLGLAQGEDGTVVATIARAGDFSGAVTLTITGAPAGLSASADPSTVPAGSTSSQIQVHVGPTVAPDTYTLTVLASGSGVEDATATLTVTVTAASPGTYTLSIDPTSLTIQQGNQGTAMVVVDRSGGFAGEVAFSVSGLPSGMTGVFGPTSTTGDSTLLTLAVGASVDAADYPLSITGSASELDDQTTSLTVTVTAVGPGNLVSLAPEDWRIPIGDQVQFSATIEGPATATVDWSVNGLAGGNDAVGTIAPDGTYTAPQALPTVNPVIVRAALASSPDVIKESPVTITSGGEQARILYHAWTPRVVDQASTDSLTYEISFAGYPRFDLERPGGARLAAAPIRSGVYGFRMSATDVLAGYNSGDLHNFVGYLNCDICARVRRGNVFVNVRDATVPSTSATQLAEDVQVAPHVVNIRYDSLFFAGAIPPDVLRAFYALFPDDFDFIAVVEQVNSFNNRSYRSVRNSVSGLGLSTFDRGAVYGSATRLQGLIDFPISSFFDGGEKAAIHEIGHRWMAFLRNPILATGVPHWPISSIARGIMGYSGPGGEGSSFPYEVRRVSGNIYELDCTMGYADQYNDLELYLMGFLPADSVGTNAVFQDQNIQLGCGVQGTADTITVQDIIAVNGVRVPDYQSAPRDFRLATIVLSRGRLLTAEELAFFDYMAARGEATTELHYTSGFAEGTAKPFYLATGGRATLTTRVWP